MCYAQRKKCQTRRSTSWSAEVNHNWRKQRYMKGSLVEPELITVTAASLSQETRNRWCCNAVGQNFTATITVKSSRAEMWDKAWRKKSGKGNIKYFRGTWLRRESDKRPWYETKISEGPVGRLDNRNTIVKGKKSLPPSQIVTHFQRD